MKKVFLLTLTIFALSYLQGQNDESQEQLADKMSAEICDCMQAEKNANYIVLDYASDDCFMRILSSYQYEITDILPDGADPDDEEVLEKYLMPLLFRVYMNLEKNDCMVPENENLVMAYEFYDSKEYATAIEYYQKVPNRYMGFFEYNALGLCYYYLSEKEKAIENYNIALEFRPFSSTVHSNIAYAYLYAGDTIKALQSIEDAAILNKREGHYYDFANEFYAIKNYSKAQLLYEKAIETNPSEINAYIKLIDIYEDVLKDEIKAMDLLKQKYATDSLNSTIVFKLVDRYIKYGNCDSAAQILDNYYENITTTYYSKYTDVGNCYFESGQYNIAKNYYHKLDTAMYFFVHPYILGVTRCERKLGNFDNALRTINSGIAADSSQVYFLERAKTYHAMGEYETALEDYNYIIEENPSECEFYRERLRCYENMNNTKMIKRDQEILQLLSCGNEEE